MSGIGSAIARIIGAVPALYRDDLLFAVAAAVSRAAWGVLSTGVRDPRQHGQTETMLDSLVEP